MKIPQPTMPLKFYWLTISIGISMTSIFSQAGMLDNTFGNQGIVVTDIEDSDFIHAMVIQPDQKIVVAGYINGQLGFGGVERMVVIRYLPDGSFDPDFGVEGIARIDCSDYCHFYGMAIQADGRIVLAGYNEFWDIMTKSDFQDFAVVRLNANGSPDSTFGNAGLVTTDLNNYFEQANEVLLQDDGKIIIAGRSYNDTLGRSCFVMIRYESNGDLDQEFGDQGIVTTFLQESAEPLTAIFQADGKIILAGYAYSGSNRDFAMVRYLLNGSVDSLFGINGIVETDLNGNNKMDLATGIVLEPDGRIVLSGYANFQYIPSVTDIGAVRYNEDGSMDNTFGNNGIEIIHLGSRTQIHAITRQPDGKYILAGNTDVVDSTDYWLLIRLLHDGQVDTTFGNHGFISSNLTGDNGTILAMDMQDDGKIVVGGVNSPSHYQDIFLARYFTDNSIGLHEIKSFPISIFPNPCLDHLSIDVRGKSGPFQFIISDLSGRILNREILSAGENQKINIDTRALLSGYYLLQITNHELLGVVPFVVMK